MPPALCCVPKCSNRMGHKFPKDEKQKKAWIFAIRRDKWNPSPFSVVCGAHFLETDYVQSTVHGTNPLIKRLKKEVVPSQFAWTLETSKSDIERAMRVQRRSSSSNQTEDEEVFFQEDIEIGMEVDITDDGEEVFSQELPKEPIHVINNSTQTPRKPLFGVERYIEDANGIQLYSGCDSCEKFQLILHSLGPAAHHLNYYTHDVKNVSVENQLFMTLVKLRQHWSNAVLADFFEVSEGTVSNIFVTWINFMYHQWKEVCFWPDRDLVKFYSPSGFQSLFPQARVIIDGTECPIQKPSKPLFQQASFSTYKNRNTTKVLVGGSPGGLISFVSPAYKNRNTTKVLVGGSPGGLISFVSPAYKNRNTTKVLVGGSPGGLISFVSPAYAGSASDRQIVERSALLQMCDKGDEILADKGFNVQDMFAPYDVKITTPAFFKNKNRLDCETVQADRKIANKRVHIERLIGLAKTFKILKQSLTVNEAVLSSEIIYVCCVLCNFKECIVPKSA